MKRMLFLIIFVLSPFVGSQIFSQTLIWQPTNYSLTGNVNTVHIGPNGWLYAGSYSEGVFVSSDKGNSWIQKNNGLKNLQIFAFLNVKDTIFLGSLEGVYRSSDFGNSWEPSNNGLTDKYINTLAITKDRKLLCGTLYSGLFISTDFGRTWNQMQNDFKNKSVNCILTKSDGFVFVGTTSGLYRATQMFDFWGKVDADFKNNTNINTIALDSSGNIYAGTNNGKIFKSTNNGVNWTQVYESTNNSIYKIIVSPQNIIYAATYGKGVLRSKTGTDWEEVNDGLFNQLTTSIVALPTREFFVSTWGNGVFYGKEYEISTFVEGEFCTNNEIPVDYVVTMNFNPDNYFIAQLSDNNGKFTNPVEIGRIQSTTSGTIICKIPSNTPTGILYRIRVVSTSPAIIGADNRKNIRIYKNLSPVISGKASVCHNDVETYSGSTKPGVISVWTVTNGEVVNIDTTNNTITIQWNQVGTGKIKLFQTLQGGKCSDSTIISVTVNPRPEKPVIYRKGFVLYSSSKTGNQWFLFDKPIPGATADSLPVTEAGLYYVQVTNEFGCKSEMSDPFDFYYNSVEFEQDEFKIIPNPANSTIKINLPENTVGISIFDLLGNQQITIPNLTGITSPITVDISSLPNGTYLVVVRTIAGNFYKKIIVSR